MFLSWTVTDLDLKENVTVSTYRQKQAPFRANSGVKNKIKRSISARGATPVSLCSDLLLI